MEKKTSRKRTTIQHVLKSKSKCEIPTERQMCMVNRLPSEILMDLLSRLPTDSILQCRQVCQPWEKLTCHPSFADMHLHQISHLNGNSYSCNSSVIGAMVDVGLLFCFRFSRELGFQLYYGEYDSQPNRKLRRINQPSMNYHSIVGSCNGLICFSEMNLSTSVKFEPVCICNPITREYVNLARLLEVKGENKLDSMVCGFGYHHSTKKYKIVKIYYIEGKPLGQVQVYTLGHGSGWSDAGETNYSLRFSKDSWRGASYRHFHVGAFANGAIHWLNKDLKIVSFDLASEKFYLLSSPPVVHVVNVRNLFQLQVLGGCLCFVHQKLNEFLDIWFLRKKGESNSSDVSEQEDDLWTWIKEFSIPIGGSAEAEPLSLTKSGEVLLWYKSNLCHYDKNTADLEKLLESIWWSFRFLLCSSSHE